MQKYHIVSLCLAFAFCFSFLAGCTESPSSLPENTSTPESTAPITAESLPATTQQELKAVEQVGIVPDSLRTVVEKNTFHEAVSSGGRILKTFPLIKDEIMGPHEVRYGVQMLDIYGNEIATYRLKTDDAYHITTLTATADGGFLFVLGFRNYAYSQDSWASDNGFSSHVIKCDKDGNLLFDTAFDQIEGSALRYCFEKNGQFYLFDDRETPETKIRGVYSRTDIYMAILDQNGILLNTQYIAGSDYDSLYNAEITDDGFLLSISAQSQDGDFVGSTSIYPIDWTFTVDDTLRITDRKKESGRSYFDNMLGEKNGQAIYMTDIFQDGFDAGTPTAYIDYGDFYLIVSENATGEYEHSPPQLNILLYYWETVYSGYDREGNLIFRASVDASPDYDTMVQRYQG